MAVMNVGEIMSWAERAKLIAPCNNYYPTAETDKEIRDLLGSGLESTMKDIVDHVFKVEISEGPIDQDDFIGAAIGNSLTYDSIREWALRKNKTELYAPLVYAGSVAVFAKEYAKQMGWIKQRGLTVSPVRE